MEKGNERKRICVCGNMREITCQNMPGIGILGENGVYNDIGISPLTHAAVTNSTDINTLLNRRRKNVAEKSIT